MQPFSRIESGGCSSSSNPSNDGEALSENMRGVGTASTEVGSYGSARLAGTRRSIHQRSHLEGEQLP